MDGKPLCQLVSEAYGNLICNDFFFFSSKPFTSSYSLDYLTPVRTAAKLTYLFGMLNTVFEQVLGCPRVHAKA